MRTVGLTAEEMRKRKENQDAGSKAKQQGGKKPAPKKEEKDVPVNKPEGE